jgi:hypothetical protein
MLAMHILASDFSGIAWIFVAIPFVLIALAAISFIPAALGHWSAVLLATPAVLLGLMFVGLITFAVARTAPMPFGACALILAPPVLGILSLGVWSERRRSKMRE